MRPRRAANPDAPKYNADGRLIPPADYRDWVFLSSGAGQELLRMPWHGGRPHVRQRIYAASSLFAPRAAYAEFKRRGVWPDKTVLMLENYGAKSKGSINRLGRFQTSSWASRPT